MLDYGEMKNNLLVYKSKEQIADICIAHYKEIERLNNIINELEVFLKEGTKLATRYRLTKEYVYAYENILDKLQELKGE